MRLEAWSARAMERAMGPQQRPVEASEVRRAELQRSMVGVGPERCVDCRIECRVDRVLGIGVNSAVLVAFGCIGIVDAVGSTRSLYHFRHSLRHDRFSHELERLAHRIVLVGLAIGGAGCDRSRARAARDGRIRRSLDRGDGRRCHFAGGAHDLVDPEALDCAETRLEPLHSSPMPTCLPSALPKLLSP